MTIVEKIMKTVCSLLLCFISTLSYAMEREVIDFNYGWQFCLTDNVSEPLPLAGSEWREVNLPYDFQLNMPWVESASRSRGFKKRAAAWFRKDFMADEAWKGRKVVLDFEGLMYYGDVYLNGKRVGGTEYGYCGFDCDISAQLNYGGKNVVDVYTDTGVDGGSRWYTGGGINRDVRLILADTVSLARHGIYVTASPLGDIDGIWQVNVQAEYPGKTLSMGGLETQARIIDASGNVVAESEMTACPTQSRQELVEVKLPALSVSHPDLWSCETPHLYNVEVTTYCDGVVCDRQTERFGFRTLEYGADFGFKLNGKKVFLQGIANHVDFGGVGVAAYRTAIARQLKQLKAFGFNAVRCSHNPYPECFYDLCDEMGILVVDEFVDKWSTDGNCWGGRVDFLSCWVPLMQEWVKRDRNHPCVIMWSLGNEMQHRENASGYMTGDWGVTMFRMMDVLLKRYDTTRPSTAAMYPARANGIRRADEGFRVKENIIPPELSCVTEIASYNYEYADYPRYKECNPNLIIFQSEASVNDLVTPFLRMDRASTVGLCYWGAIEYWGESDGWPKKGWNYSFFDHTLAPYPRAYLLRSCFKENEPQVHIGVLDGEQKSIIWNDILSGRAEMSHFYWKPNAGDSITLEISTNCDEVELLQNGKSLGVKMNNRLDDKQQNKLLWRDIPWKAGKVTAVARNNGSEVARHELRSPGKPARLMMTVEENPMPDKAVPDLVYVRLQVVDNKGVPVDNYEGDISLEVEGKAALIALDNGNHFTDIPLDRPITPLYRGGALAILRPMPSCGEIQVTASCQGMKSVTTKINVK